MRGVAHVIPVVERDIVVKQVRHAIESATRFQERMQQTKLLVRSVEVFNHLAASHVVVREFEHIRIVVKEGVELINFVTPIR